MKRRRPAISPEAREKQMIALALDQAEKQLIEGTASSQVIVHFLKLATTREALERDKLALENELVKAKTEAINDGKKREELYEEAIKAMRRYRGESGSYEED